MKFTVKKQAKLTLDRQTVRELAKAELGEVAGGAANSDRQSQCGPFKSPRFCA